MGDLPLSVRRELWGWFGEPWPSGVCYDDNGVLKESMRKPFPAGETCTYCDQSFVEGDAGQAMPTVGVIFPVGHVHKECLLRNVLGSLSCYLGEHNHNSDKTYRQEALELWQYLDDTNG